MDSSFVPSIIALRNANPDMVITKLHAMFQTITKMDADEVVAAYQTVRTTAEAMNMTQDHMVQTLLNALIAQMHRIASAFGGGDQKRRFKAVTGREFDQFGLFS